MTETAFAPFWFSPPGKTLLKMIASRGLTAPQLAERLGRTNDEFLSVIAGTQPIDNSLADDLGRELGPSGAFWKQRQADFDDDLDRVSEACKASDAADWLNLLPIEAMFENHCFKKSDGDLYRCCLVYFDVSSPAEWSSRYTTSSAMLRASSAFEAAPGALALWLREVERRATLRSCKPWSAAGLQQALPELRRLTRIPQAAKYIPKAQQLLSETGVALELVRPIGGCTASGTARFVDIDRAAIGLSLRHGTNDHFWFTLFHEIGHLLLHDPNTAWIDDKLEGGDPREDEANEFAATNLIPTEFRAELASMPATYKNTMRLAHRIGIHPSIIVGQLQHSGRIPYSHLNRLKRSAKWSSVKPNEIAE